MAVALERRGVFMTENAQYLSEFVCGSCSRTGHATWEGTGAARRLLESTELVEQQSGGTTVFACAHCGTTLSTI